MSRRELERVEVMGRVASRDLKLVDAVVMQHLSYRTGGPAFDLSDITRTQGAPSFVF